MLYNGAQRWQHVLFAIAKPNNDNERNKQSTLEIAAILK